MDLNEYGADAAIEVNVCIKVNDECVFHAESVDIDEAIAELGRAERMDVIPHAIEEQWQDQLEPVGKE